MATGLDWAFVPWVVVKKRKTRADTAELHPTSLEWIWQGIQEQQADKNRANEDKE